MIRVAALALLAVALSVGCDRSASTPGGGPTGAGARKTPLMQPFQGPWKFDAAKTVARWQADAVPAAEVAQAQAMGAALHPDMTIGGDAAVLAGPIEGEYAFFALHPHNQWVCGKAWHHEDREDPGDMSKCYARLELREDGKELHLSLRMEEDAANPNDPDVMNMPATAGSASNCGADGAPAPAWSPWRTYVFVRG